METAGLLGSSRAQAGTVCLRAVIRCCRPQIRVEGVIADIQHAARLPLVAPASFEDEPRIAAGPCAHRVVGG